MSPSQKSGECIIPEGYELPKNLYQELAVFIEELPTKAGHLVTALHKAQHLFGYLPEEVQRFVAEHMEVPVVHVYGVVTFYSFFTMTPKGKHPISICMGTACYVRGAEKVLDEFKKELNIEVGQTSPDGKFSLSSLRCVGACGLAPVVLVGDKTYGRIAPDDVKNILKEYEG